MTENLAYCQEKRAAHSPLAREKVEKCELNVRYLLGQASQDEEVDVAAENLSVAVTRFVRTVPEPRKMK